MLINSQLTSLTKQWLRPLLLLLLIVPSAPAWSQADGLRISCTALASSVYLPATTINVGREAVAGDLIGPWIAPTSTPAWNCFRDIYYPTDPTYLGISGYTYPPNLQALGTNLITVEGLSHMIYATTPDKPGLGFIVRMRTTSQGQTSPWQAFNSATYLGNTPNYFYGPMPYNNKANVLFSVEVQVHFVKTANTLTPGTVTGTFNTLTLTPFRAVTPPVTITGYYEPPISVTLSAGSISILSGGTCTTPDVSVKFRTVSVGAFSGTGSVAALTPFNLLFNDCPAGMNSISYRFNATTSILNAAKGVVALDPTATAKGVGIQLLTANSTPIVFSPATGSTYKLDSYNPSIRGSYNVPLLAGIYQVSSQVTAGSIKGAVTFTLDYR